MEKQNDISKTDGSGSLRSSDLLGPSLVRSENGCSASNPCTVEDSESQESDRLFRENMNEIIGCEISRAPLLANKCERDRHLFLAALYLWKESGEPGLKDSRILYGTDDFQKRAQALLSDPRMFSYFGLVLPNSVISINSVELCGG